MSSPADTAGTDEIGPTLQEPQNLTGEELEELTEAEVEVEPVSYSGIEYDAEGLVRRLNRNEIIVPTFGHGDETLELLGFQRGFVWRKPQMDRFIESLLLGFPIPGIMLVQQIDKRYLVIDGQQRLKTLQAFYKGVFNGKEFGLENVATEFRGLTYDSLSAEQRRTIDNTFIQATIVKTDGRASSLESIYQVFERLNSGGTQLTGHEIRIALYPGRLIDAIAMLNTDSAWRAIYGPPSPRLRDHELILRVLALFSRGAEYARPQKTFLNEFVREHRDLSRIDWERISSVFQRAAILLAEAGGYRAVRRSGGRLNAALLEAIFVGTMHAIDASVDLDVTKVAQVLEVIIENTELSASVSGSTALEENVRTRLRIATEAFVRNHGD